MLASLHLVRCKREGATAGAARAFRQDWREGWGFDLGSQGEGGGGELAAGAREAACAEAFEANGEREWLN